MLDSTGILKCRAPDQRLKVLAPIQGRFSHIFLSYYRPPLGAIFPHSLFLFSNTPPPCPSSSRMAQTYFERNLYLYIYKHPSNLVPVIIFVHINYEDGTECSETSARKIQTENHPKNNIKTLNTECIAFLGTARNHLYFVIKVIDQYIYIYIYIYI